MIQQVWQAHLLHLPKQKNHIAHALCTHLHMLLHLFPLHMKQSYKGSPSLSLSPSYPLGLFLSLPDFFTFQTYISTKVPKYPRFCLQSSPLGYSYHTIFFSTEKKETGWPLVRMVSISICLDIFRYDVGIPIPIIVLYSTELVSLVQKSPICLNVNHI